MKPVDRYMDDLKRSIEKADSKPGSQEGDAFTQTAEVYNDLNNRLDRLLKEHGIEEGTDNNTLQYETMSQNGAFSRHRSSEDTAAVLDKSDQTPLCAEDRLFYQELMVEDAPQEFRQPTLVLAYRPDRDIDHENQEARPSDQNKTRHRAPRYYVFSSYDQDKSILAKMPRSILPTLSAIYTNLSSSHSIPSYMRGKVKNPAQEILDSLQEDGNDAS